MNENAAQVDCNVAGTNLQITPIGEFSGTATCQIRVSDTSGASAAAVMTINVASANDAPVIISNIATQILGEDTPRTINLSDYFSDVDSVLTFAVASDDPAKVDCSVSGAVLTMTPVLDYSGTSTCSITATDNQFTTPANTFSIIV